MMAGWHLSAVVLIAALQVAPLAAVGHLVLLMAAEGGAVQADLFETLPPLLGAAATAVALGLLVVVVAGTALMATALVARIVRALR